MVFPGVVVSVLVFLLYLKTLAPTILPYKLPYLADSPMLQMEACVLGIAHPTGYPSYLMLTHLITYLPFGNCAYRANLASAVYAALAVLLVYAGGWILCRRVVAAVTGALAFGVGNALWSQAVITEVYTLNALLVALALVVLLLWRERRKDRYLLFAAFCVGLAPTDHATSALLWPAALLFVAATDWRKLLQWRLLLKGAGAFLLGLSPYLYLPIRASMDPPFNNNDPSSPQSFWWLVSGGNLRGTFFIFGPEKLMHRVPIYWHHLMNNLDWWMLAAVAAGLGATLFWDRAVALLLGFLFAGWVLFMLEDYIPDNNLYLIPTYLILSLWIAVGAALVLDNVETLTIRLRKIPRLVLLSTLSLVLILSPLWGVQTTYAKNDISHDYQGQKVINTVAKNTAPHATVLQHRSDLWYMVLVEKRRRDLTLVDPFYHDTRIRYDDLVWPHDDMSLKAMNHRYGTGDRTGVTAAKKAVRRGPVYVLAGVGVNGHPFYAAHFHVIHVKGPLYRLVPPSSSSSRRHAGHA